MTSYFFHIALDLYQPPSSSVDPLAQISKAFRTPFRAIIKQPPLQPGEEGIQNSASAGTDQQPIALDTPDASKSSLLRSTRGDRKRATEGVATLDTADDWRYDKISVQEINMARSDMANKHDRTEDIARHMSNGLAAGPGGLATKGRYEPSDPQGQDLGWGIVRLYRDAQETPGLYEDASSPKVAKTFRNLDQRQEKERPRFRDEDCTTLCILAVPSYLTPSDFLGFVGEKTREEVSHFRMIRTERSNRYMVLMKFRHGRKAREWRKEWNGKSFDGMEVCSKTAEGSCGR